MDQEEAYTEENQHPEQELLRRISGRHPCVYRCSTCRGSIQ